MLLADEKVIPVAVPKIRRRCTMLCSGAISPISELGTTVLSSLLAEADSVVGVVIGIRTVAMLVPNLIPMLVIDLGAAALFESSVE